MRGIYMIHNCLTGECYIGSAKDIAARWEGHRAALKRGKHHIDRSPQLKLGDSWAEHCEPDREYLM